MGLIDIFPQPDLATSVIPPVGITWRKNDLYNRDNYSWTEIVASTPQAYSGYSLNAHHTPTAKNNPIVMALATGPAGSEEVIAVFPVRDQKASGVGLDGVLALPRTIPAGTRIAAALMSSSSHPAAVQCFFYPDPLPSLSLTDRVDYGPLNLTGGFSDWGDLYQLTFPVAMHTKSAWQEITAPGANNAISGSELSQQYSMLGLFLQPTVTISNDDDMAIVLDFAHGASGAEIPFVEGLYRYGRNRFLFSGPSITWVPWGRPVGDRISVRVQHNNDAITPPVIEVALVGLQ